MDKISLNNLVAKYQPKAKKEVFTQQLTIDEVNKVFETIADLVTDGFRPWYCKAIKLLGPTSVLDMATEARKGTVDKKKLMSRLTSDALKGLK